MYWRPAIFVDHECQFRWRTVWGRRGRRVRTEIGPIRLIYPFVPRRQSVKVFSETKVSKNDVSRTRKEDIARFDVAVDDAAAVKEVESNYLDVTSGVSSYDAPQRKNSTDQFRHVEASSARLELALPHQYVLEVCGMQLLNIPISIHEH